MPLDVDSLRVRLPQRGIVWLDTAATTMTEAARLAAAGCPAGTFVIAEEQTAGLGRHGRGWHSERETGLYVSMVLRPSLEPDSLPVLTLALGLAVQEAIACATGILCQTADSAVVAGIGVNVNQQAFPPELAATATSLRMISGGPHSREDLLVELARSVDSYANLLVEQGADRVLRLYAERARR